MKWRTEPLFGCCHWNPHVFAENAANAVAKSLIPECTNFSANVIGGESTQFNFAVAFKDESGNCSLWHVVKE